MANLRSSHQFSRNSSPETVIGPSQADDLPRRRRNFERKILDLAKTTLHKNSEDELFRRRQGLGYE